MIVEGYTDALMAHQAGFDNVVASLGTALTPGQVALLTRYAKRIALAYDVDAAGEKAGTFGVQALEALIGQLAAADTGVELDEVRVVRLPDGKDPDEVVRESARPLARGGPDRPADRRLPDRPRTPRPSTSRRPAARPASSTRSLPTLRGDPEPGHARRLPPDDPQRVAASRSGRVLEVLHQRPDADSTVRGPDHRRRRHRAAADALPVDRILAAITPVEEELLRLLLLAPEQQARAADEIGPDQLPSTPARELFRAIVLQRAAGRSRGPAAVLDVGADGRARRRDPGDGPGDPRQAVARSRARGVGADHVRRRSMPAPARADEARRARRLGRWRAPGRGMRRGDRELVGRLVTLQQQNNEARSIRGSPNRTSNRLVGVTHAHRSPSKPDPGGH